MTDGSQFLRDEVPNHIFSEAYLDKLRNQFNELMKDREIHPEILRILSQPLETPETGRT